ncbi:MAG: hypothetical protein VX431_01525, partial [Planctomycetota bacterium]|nr:hypothetical protein [Planctomycetota bacterium]
EVASVTPRNRTLSLTIQELTVPQSYNKSVASEIVLPLVSAVIRSRKTPLHPAKGRTFGISRTGGLAEPTAGVLPQVVYSRR